MAISLSRITDSPNAIRLVMALGHLLPRRLGHLVAGLVARQMAGRRDSPLVRAIRCNQWVVSGGTLEKAALCQAVQRTIQYSANAIFDLYHYLDDLQAADRLIVLDDRVRGFLGRPEFSGRGLLIAGLHTSNFDLCLQWLCRRGMKPLVLTIPNPQGGRRMEFEIRRKSGMNLVPASMTALRQAVKHLQQGGVVATGIDRPIPEPDIRPLFFNHPAALPTHHIHMAIRARVPIMLMAVNFQSDGKYHIRTSEPFEMEPHPNREIQTLQNAEGVLKIAEGFIRNAPQQWSMSLPVWPELLDKIPD